MSEFVFGLGRGHLPAKANEAAKKHGAWLVNYTEPGSREKRHWFAALNRGDPHNRNRSEAVAEEVATIMGWPKTPA